MNYRSLIFPTLLVLSTAALTRYYWPRIETKTVIQRQVVVKKDIRTVTRVVERKDGTKETIIDTVDRSTETKQSSKEVVALAKSQWLVAATAVQDIDSRLLKPALGVHVQRRILGPFFAGVMANSRREMGLSIGAEF